MCTLVWFLMYMPKMDNFILQLPYLALDFKNTAEGTQQESHVDRNYSSPLAL